MHRELGATHSLLTHPRRNASADCIRGERGCIGGKASQSGYRATNSPLQAQLSRASRRAVCFKDLFASLCFFFFSFSFFSFLFLFYSLYRRRFFVRSFFFFFFFFCCFFLLFFVVFLLPFLRMYVLHLAWRLYRGSCDFRTRDHVELDTSILIDRLKSELRRLDTCGSMVGWCSTVDYGLTNLPFLDGRAIFKTPFVARESVEYLEELFCVVYKALKNFIDSVEQWFLILLKSGNTFDYICGTPKLMIQKTNENLQRRNKYISENILVNIFKFYILKYKKFGFHNFAEHLQKARKTPVKNQW